MRRYDFPYYWFLFPPCEGCSVLRPRFRPAVIIRPRFSGFRVPKVVFFGRRSFGRH